ncbi:MAG: D-aminoacylase [Gemmatimonadetes bacterium]|nr:D-aminoacylase [Gemmatimonadota bacterium]NNM06761.1 D-aminoacylase [Gemmatimonadota bacterium]
MTRMDRREFVRAGAAVGLTSLSGIKGLPWWETPDLVLRGGTVFDGTGAPGVEADVAVVGDRIQAIGRVPEQGAMEIDLTGQAVAPGFIDIHTHADRPLLDVPMARHRVLQGITLEVGGQCGGSPGPSSEAAAQAARERYRKRYGVEVDLRELGGFFRALEEIPPTVNAASMVGHGTVRGLIVGNENRPATPHELAEMRRLVAGAMAQGAVGFSTGLEYTPSGFAPKEELVELAKALRGTGFPYASHMRNEDDGVLAAVEEALHVGRVAGVPVQISHLKAQGERNWWKAPVILDLLEEAREAGVDVHFDRYPYVAYSTGLSNLFPAAARAGGSGAFVGRLQDPEERPALEAYCRDKIAQLGSWDSVQISSTRRAENAWMRGKRLGEVARELREDPFDLTVRLLVEEGGSVGMIGFGMSEENTALMLSHPLGMICSDGSVYSPSSSGSPHPRSFGTFPRVLGHYVRDEGVMPLETAIHKMTGMSAKKIQLVDRGVLRPGAYADLVAFDPATVGDGATFAEPRRPPTGISLVVVNGAVTVREGGLTGERAGRPVRGAGA